MIDAALRCTLWNAIFKLELLVFNLSLLFPNQPSPSPREQSKQQPKLPLIEQISGLKMWATF